MQKKQPLIKTVVFYRSARKSIMAMAPALCDATEPYGLKK